MVEDEEIKTTVSPFAMREGEIKTFDGKDGYVSINQIINKINIGHITDIHFSILELVNEFEFITSRQLYQILETKGIEVKSQDKLNNKLEQLIKTKILTRYYFTAEAGKGIYRVYCLEKMGKYLLNSRGIEYLRKVKAFDGYKIKPVINAKQNGKTFKLHACVKVSKNGKSAELIFEAVRREEDWERKLVDRMKLLKDFYENFVQFDSGFANKPQLVLLCEDGKHAVEAFKTIVLNQLEIANTKICITTDLKQNASNLSNSLSEFVIDEATGKYKMQEVNLKILE